MSIIGAIFVSVGVLFGVTSVKTARANARSDQERRRRRRREAFVQHRRSISTIWQRAKTPRTDSSSSTGPTVTSTDPLCISCQEGIPQEAIGLLQDEFLRPLNQAPNCNHFWCHECLKGRFEAVLKDRTLWPPACCNKVPFTEMDVLALNLLDTEQHSIFRSKSEEYETKNPLYCPKKTCSAFIPMRPQPDNRFGHGYLRSRSSKDTSVTCKKCKTMVCTQCKQPWHPPSIACTKDEDTQKFDELVEKEMWASCPACNQTIELAHGCNHMVCLCKKEFCYVCKGNWNGSCPCPPWSKVKEQRNAQPPITAAPTRPTITRMPTGPLRVVNESEETLRPALVPQRRDSGVENMRIGRAREMANARDHQRELDDEERRREENFRRLAQENEAREEWLRRELQERLTRERQEREAEERRRQEQQREENRRRLAQENQAREEWLRRELQERLAREREERRTRERIERERIERERIERERSEREEREQREQEERKNQMREAIRRRKAAEVAELLERQEALDQIEREREVSLERLQANKGISHNLAAATQGRGDAWQQKWAGGILPGLEAIEAAQRVSAVPIEPETRTAFNIPRRSLHSLPTHT